MKNRLYPWRLIDETRLVQELFKLYGRDTLDLTTLNCCMKTVKDAPTVAAAPEVHGRWDTIEVYGKTTLYRCTACKTEMIDYTGREGYHRYCHNCGARMDGGEERE